MRKVGSREFLRDFAGEPQVRECLALLGGFTLINACSILYQKGTGFVMLTRQPARRRPGKKKANQFACGRKPEHTSERVERATASPSLCKPLDPSPRCRCGQSRPRATPRKVLDHGVCTSLLLSARQSELATPRSKKADTPRLTTACTDYHPEHEGKAGFAAAEPAVALRVR